MCGIAGIIGPGEYQEAIERMVAAMRHRGPDDSGVEILTTADGAVALGSTRLAIIDLSPAGHMPMVDPDTGNWIVYNGEVYNFYALRRELEGGGVRFHSATDSEVILKAYGHWGSDCVARFRGMFALAIWDCSHNQLFIARDRVGKKPLYYSYNGAGRFMFASEVRALLASGLVARRLNSSALESYLFHGFVVAPHTIIADLWCLLPGHWMYVAAGGDILERRRYWWLRARTDPIRAVAERVSDIASQLEDAVRLRLISDVPLGVFLSGGLDSSAIVALMARSGSDVRTFSVTFDEAKYDESKFSDWVAQRFDTLHTEVRLRRSDFEAWLPDALAAMDQPTFDGLNTYYVARAARESGLTVALTGAGGDEVFGGYPFFREVPWLLRMARVLRYIPDSFSKLIYYWLSQPPPKVSGPLKTLELLEGTLGGPLLLAAYQTAQLHYPRWVRNSLLVDHESKTWFGLPPESIEFISDGNLDGDRASQLSMLAIRLFLAERCLRDIDTMSMGVSLEVRAPFIDHLFIEEVWQLPGYIRCAGAPDKPFEWRLLRSYLGDGYAYRKKQGFAFPFEEWLRTPAFLEQIQATLFDRTLAAQVGLNPQTLEHIFHAFAQPSGRMPWSRLWSVFAVFHWCRHNQVYL